MPDPMTTQPNQERQRAERVGRRLQMSGLLYNNSDSTVALIVRIIEEEMIPALTPPTAIQKPKEGHCVTDDGVERKVLGQLFLTEDGCVCGDGCTVFSKNGHPVTFPLPHDDARAWSTREAIGCPGDDT